MKPIIKSVITLNLLFIIVLTACSQNPKTLSKMNNEVIPKGILTDTATFGEGCFWCTEAFFQRLKGVYKVISGYGG
ncbi:MAG: peptide-methionine (S)-S-oxide reductase, partial [Bacteroidota bacterium]